MAGFASRARDRLLSYADDNGQIDQIALFGLEDWLKNEWRKTYTRWKVMLEAGRRQAAELPLGLLAFQHEHYFGHSASLRVRDVTEAGPVKPPIVQTTTDVLNAAGQRVYGDGFNLSQRIWKLDEQSWQGIRGTVWNAVVGGKSAWNTAKELESYLGASQSCPRWTSTRLFKLTKTDIAAGNRTGLITGGACASQGVAYNALRLARNEMQIAHAMATDEMFKRSPWILKEKVNLSPSHPPIDCECPNIANGGEGGRGIYPKGTIQLPVHVQCLCFKTAVMMSDGDFAKQLQGWLSGVEANQALDDYVDWWGITRSMVGRVMTQAAFAVLTTALSTWLEGDERDMEQALEVNDG